MQSMAMLHPRLLLLNAIESAQGPSGVTHVMHLKAQN